MHGLAAPDPYTDHALVPDDAARRSLALYKTFIINPKTDTATRLACLAKTTSVLDSLPAVRAFDFPNRQRGADRNRAVPHRSAAFYQLLLERALAYSKQAAAHRQLGDSQSAASSYDRTTMLLEKLIRALPRPGSANQGGTANNSSSEQPEQLSSEESEYIEAFRVYATNTLLHVIGDWVVIEQALGRNAKADKLLARADKWRVRRENPQ
ncbi:hypothetical protein GGI07_004099 [Coemansia sp. Benny D115]|nr:hypothetical protein GGI07_004099 [Coemansia sp. Benny D115]